MKDNYTITIVDVTEGMMKCTCHINDKLLEYKNGDFYKTLGRDRRVDISSNNIVRVTSDMFYTKSGDEQSSFTAASRRSS